jgi:hypothetical protein
MNKVLGKAVSKKKIKKCSNPLKKIKKWPEENVKCQASERATSVKRGPSGPTPPTGICISHFGYLDSSHRHRQDVTA